MAEINPIAFVRSPFREKFGIPRQPGLCPAVSAEIVFEKNNFNKEALREITDVSHIWVIFQFSSLKKVPDKARIRPPRLGGNTYVGVFSSRSPYRPNSLGMSLVALNDMYENKNEIVLVISSHDLLDGTPIFDIKPIITNDIPADGFSNGWQNTDWHELKVEFSEDLKIDSLLKEQLRQILSQDPRPAYSAKNSEGRIYHMVFAENEISFSVIEQVCKVIEIKPFNNS